MGRRSHVGGVWDRPDLVIIDTVEEVRAVDLVERAAGRLEIPVFHWSITRGVTSAERTGSTDLTIAGPVDVLGHVAQLRAPFVAIMKDLHHHLDAPVAIRALRRARGPVRAP